MQLPPRALKTTRRKRRELPADCPPCLLSAEKQLADPTQRVHKVCRRHQSLPRCAWARPGLETVCTAHVQAWPSCASCPSPANPPPATPFATGPRHRAHPVRPHPRALHSDGAGVERHSARRALPAWRPTQPAWLSRGQGARLLSPLLTLLDTRSAATCKNSPTRQPPKVPERACCGCRARERLCSSFTNAARLDRGRLPPLPRGSQKSKYKTHEFGACPRTLCDKQDVLPIGLSDTHSTSNENPLKLFCPRCQVPAAIRATRGVYCDGLSLGTTCVFYVTYC